MSARPAGRFELAIVASVGKAGLTASEIRSRLGARLGRDVADGQLHLSLGRMVARGLLEFTVRGPVKVRGGRNRNVYTSTEAGRKELEEMLAVLVPEQEDAGPGDGTR